MRRDFIFGAICIAMLLVGLSLVPAAQAQEIPDQVNESDVIETEQSETEADTLNNQQQITVGNVEIQSWEFNNDRIRIAIEADRPRSVILSDGAAGMGESGAFRVPEVDQRVLPGDPMIISMPVEEFAGGHSVTVSQGGESVRIGTDMDTEETNPLHYFGGESGLFTGILVTLGLSVTAAGYVIWREESGVIEA